jgi:hypothetical protein
MTKSKAIHRFTQSNLHLSHRDVEVIVTAILDEIASGLLRDDRVELRGSWENRHLGALPRRLRPPASADWDGDHRWCTAHPTATATTARRSTPRR